MNNIESVRTHNELYLLVRRVIKRRNRKKLDTEGWIRKKVEREEER